ncbi:hypothetical protein SAMN05444158_7171 [Bradyrhizobium canariense]|uniref:Uncharacterized protein n=1 Tax=Bradyrhizobium canariense TaxID=255045 RepID=A0A1H2BHN0_9BRAD|nr:hypothetical protein SAMN05444158_7171 [Bradyrhizobium canariense]
MPQKDCTSRVSLLLNFEVWDGLSSQNLRPIELAAETNISGGQKTKNI